MKRKTRTGHTVTMAGNDKTGRYPCINLPSGPKYGCCSPDCEGTCWLSCYDRFARGTSPNVLAPRLENLAAYRADPAAYFETVADILRPFPFGRWHSAGDIPDRRYAVGMVWVANHTTGRQLAFTKRPELLDRLTIPDNLSIIVSQWPKRPVYHGRFRSAWLSADHRKPADTLDCPGHCDSCGLCWHLKELERDVSFVPHGAGAKRLLALCERMAEGYPSGTVDDIDRYSDV